MCIGAIGLAGPTFSADAIQMLNLVCDPNHFPLVGNQATSSALSSPVTYPYFLRLFPTRQSLAYTFVSLVRLFGGVGRGVR